MSDTPASVRRQIDSATELRSVVRTMKAVAASSIGQYEDSVRALADYYRTVELGLGAAFRELVPATARNGARVRRVPAASGVVVFGSDQGLVGTFNEVVTDGAIDALRSLPAPARVWAVGERAQARLAGAGVQIVRGFGVPTSVDAVAPLVAQIVVETESHGGDDETYELLLVYNRPASGATYAPVRQRLLPLDDEWLRELVERPWATRNVPEVLGDGTASLRALLREYLFISLFRACAESLASENAARLAAMQRADKNIDELLERLQGRFRRLRQSGIDEELFDVVSGFEALTTSTAGR